MSQPLPTGDSPKNEISRLDQYVGAIVQEITSFKSKPVNNKQCHQPSIQEFAREVGVTLDDVEMFAEIPGNQPVDIELLTRPEFIAQKSVHLAFMSATALRTAKRNVELATHSLEKDLHRTVDYFARVEIAELRWDIYPEPTGREFERVRNEYLWNLDEAGIARDNLGRNVEVLERNKGTLKVVSWLAARSTRLCVIAVRNARYLDEGSMSRARKIDRMLSQLGDLVGQEIRSFLVTLDPNIHAVEFAHVVATGISN